MMQVLVIHLSFLDKLETFSFVGSLHKVAPFFGRGASNYVELAAQATHE